MTTQTTFDFGDGNGPVPAHQHANGGGWVADTAKVYPTAFVGPDAKVYGYAIVFEDARIFEKALVAGEAKVSGNAKVCGNAQIYGNARIFGNAQVYGVSRVYGKAKVFGDALVSGDRWVSFGCVTCDLSLPENLKQSIEAQCNLTVFDGSVYCYKRVNENLSSEFDTTFVYPIAGIIEAEKYDNHETVACSTGLHFSHLSYYTRSEDKKILYAKVALDDIICCLQGKIRVKKAEILGVV